MAIAERRTTAPRSARRDAHDHDRGRRLAPGAHDRGVVPPPAGPPIGVADLLANANTDSGSITYMVETLFTNAADTVAETAAKPESTLEFTPRVDAVRKIATWIPVSDEMLEDVPAMRGYIDTRLRTAIRARG
jgi:hypothetical protein